MKTVKKAPASAKDAEDRLGAYDDKRDFTKTHEPPPATGKGNRQRFVIQKHEASHLHYDFRLELGGTLRSWAVPKGPPFAKGEKRLAMEVEDHPVSYIGFEGTIPKGQYGGGTVMVWDQGTFEPLTKTPLEDLAGGKLHFVLHGSKLEGEWYLVRTKRGGSKQQWLLIRGGEDMKPVTKKGDDTSAKTGRSMKQIEATRAESEAKATKVAAKTKTKTKAAVRKSVAKKAAPAPAEPAAKKPAPSASGSKRGMTLDVRGTPVPVSNLDKVLYPKTGFTKAQVIEYYIDVSAALLPTLKDRPITLKRYPDGVDGFFFYEKRCPAHRPDWIDTTRADSKDGGIDYCVMNDLPALVWAANLADLELHTFLHRGQHQDRPDYVAFDLDPGEPAGIVECCQVAVWLKEIFDGLGLDSYPKTSGSKGLQVYVPLNTAGVTYEHTKELAHTVALLLEQQHPDAVVSRMQKSLRPGKVLVDWSQNDEHKTTINVYSLRAKERPSVSTPVTWDEVKRALKSNDASKLEFSPKDVLARIEKLGDLWAPVLTLKQKLPKLQAAAAE